MPTTVTLPVRPELVPVAVNSQDEPISAAKHCHLRERFPLPLAVPGLTGPAPGAVKVIFSPGLAPDREPNTRDPPSHLNGFSLRLMESGSFGTVPVAEADWDGTPLAETVIAQPYGCPVSLPALNDTEPDPDTDPAHEPERVAFQSGRPSSVRFVLQFHVTTFPETLLTKILGT